jgi:tetratricopeptide (TPR) repeat protein
MHIALVYNQNSTSMTSILPRASAHLRRAAFPRIRHLGLALPLVAIASFGCAKQQDALEQRLSRANDYLAAQQYDQAEKEYREVLRLAPEDPTALRQLGGIYVEQGQMLQAYPLLKKVSELQPDDAKIQVKLGVTLFALGSNVEARDAALQVLEKQPENEEALLLFVDASRTPYDIADARKLIQSLRDKDQDRARYHLALGALDLRQNDPARAESEFKTALNLDPKSIEANAALGSFYWSRNEVEEAGKALKIAADLASERSPKRLRYVDFLIQTGAGVEAKSLLEEMNRKAPDYLPPRVALMKMACAEHYQDEDCFTRVQNVLSQDPINLDALFIDGMLSLSKGDARKAIREFEYLSNTYAQNPQVRYQLAVAYLLYAKSAGAVESRRAVESAESRLDEAVKLNPRFEQAILLLSELKIRKGVPASAVDLLPPLIKERPQIAQAHYLLATAYLVQQKTDDALAVYRQMTELFPTDPQPPYLVGIILLAQGKLSDARKALERSIEIRPDYLPPIEKLIELDLADKQYASALTRVDKQIENNPVAQAWALRGKIYFAQRDFTHAEPDLLKAIELEPKLEAAYRLLAQLYVASNRQDEAIAKLSAFVENNKTVQAAPAMMQLAEIQHQRKDFAAARDVYENLLSLAPNFGLAVNNLAVLYSEHLGQLDKAYDLATKASQANPNDPNITDTLGWILYKKGDYANALRPLQESAGKLPDQPEVQFHVGMAHYMLGEEEPARLALQKAVDAPSDFPGKDEARQRLALLAVRVGAASGGVRTELENYLRQWPNDPAAMVRLAQVQERDGAVDQAVKTYEKVIADNPLYAPATRQLALLYGGRLSTDSAKAYELVTKARQAYPDDPDIAKTLGILNYRREYYPQSVELLKEAAAKRKDDPELLYYLGEAYRQLKQYAECKGVLERALTLNLSRGLAKDARRALAECSETAPL